MYGTDKVAYVRQFRASEAERAAIEALARQETVKMCEAARLLIRAGAKALGVWHPNGTAQQEVPR